MRIKLTSLLLLTVLGMVGGCALSGSPGSPDGRPHYPPTGLLIEPLDARELNYDINWAVTLNLPRTQRLMAIERFDDLIIAVEQPESIVSAVSLRDGEILWRRKIGRHERLLGVMRYGEQILVNSEMRLFFLSVRDGSIEKTIVLRELVGTGGVLIETHAIFGAISGRVFAQNIRTGTSPWAYQLTNRIATPPVVVGNNVFAADTNGVYAMIGADDGAAIWRGKTFGPITAAPASDRLGVFMACEDQAFYGLIRATGKEKWKLALDRPLRLAPRAFGLTVYLPLAEGGLLAIDSIQGELKWQVDQVALPIVELADGLLCSSKGSLELLDKDTGAVLTSARTQRLRTILVGADDSLFLVSPRGRILRLNRR